MQYLETCGKRMQRPDRQAGKAGERHWNKIAKPLHGLGLLEDALVQIAAIQGTEDISLEKGVYFRCPSYPVVRPEGEIRTKAE